MRVVENHWHISSRDVWHASRCEHCTQLAMAVAEKIPAVLEIVEPYKEDLSNKLPIIQGVEFEAILSAQLSENLGEDFLELPGFASLGATKAALEKSIPVIAQARLEAKLGSVTLTGFADLLVRDDYELLTLKDGSLSAHQVREDFTGYTVWDIKHSVKVKDNYKLQVGGYLLALEALGVASEKPSGVLAGDKSVHGFGPKELLSMFEETAQGLLGFLESNPPGSFVLEDSFYFMCPRPSICKEIYCTYPALCAATRIEQDLLTQLYRLNHHHAGYFFDAGVLTIEQLANGPEVSNVPKLKQEPYEAHQRWARVIRKGRLSNKPEFELLLPASEVAGLLPESSEGDIFFDLEWFMATGQGEDLHYVFGLSNRAEEFEKFVSADFDQEKIQLEKFVAYTIEQLEKFPDAHIYHYSDPEPKRLALMAKRHGVLVAETELIIGRMFDILPVVRLSMVTSLGSLGIKTLEKYFDSPHAELVDGEDQVENGLDSMLFFHNYLKAVEAGDESGAAALLEKIMQYNRADCVATSRLYDWLKFGLSEKVNS
jgi:predicted RecB family nuclease